MQYAITERPVADCPSKPLFKRVARELRDGWKRLTDTPNQPGISKNGSNNYGYLD